MKSKFSGFPNSTFKFLRELKKNNNRDWFNQNKDRYLSDVLQPSLQFIEAMQPKLKKSAPHFSAIAKRTGGSLMRIYRDTRFSKDKTPYKTNIGIQFRHEFGKDVHAPGYYLHIEPDEAFFGAGIWRPENSALKKIRTHIVENEDAWAKLVRSKKLKSDFEFAGDSLKRPPRDFEPEHPLIDDIKRKDFVVVGPIESVKIKSYSIIDVMAEHVKSTRHYMAFLCDALRIPF